MTKDLEPLDIFLYKGRGFTSWLIQVGTSSPYNHVAIVVDPKLSFGIESNTGHQSGVRAFDLSKPYPGKVDVFRLKHRGAVDREKVVSFLVKHLGAKYDWWGVIRLGF